MWERGIPVPSLVPGLCGNEASLYLASFTGCMERAEPPPPPPPPPPPLYLASSPGRMGTRHPVLTLFECVSHVLLSAPDLLHVLMVLKVVFGLSLLHCLSLLLLLLEFLSPLWLGFQPLGNPERQWPV